MTCELIVALDGWLDNYDGLTSRHASSSNKVDWAAGESPLRLHASLWHRSCLTTLLIILWGVQRVTLNGSLDVSAQLSAATILQQNVRSEQPRNAVLDSI